MDQAISFLSDSELIEQLTELVRTEREVTQRVVRHFAEVEVRRLYAKMGYSSLFDYATRGLGYSNAAAMRRIKAARVGKKHPEVFEYLERGEMTLSTVEVFCGLIEDDFGAVRLEQFRGKSREEAEEIAAYLKPVAPSAVRDRIRVVVVGTPDDSRQQALAFEGAEEAEENSYFRSEVDAEKRYAISFSADEEFMSLLQRAKELAFRGDKGDLALEKILGNALSDYVGKRCPKERERRRQEGKARKEKAAAGQNPGDVSPEQQPAVPSVFREPEEVIAKRRLEAVKKVPVTEGGRTLNRRIPIALRDQVLARDHFHCSYVSPSGIACCSPWDLEIDHSAPRGCTRDEGGGPSISAFTSRYQTTSSCWVYPGSER